jgi:hypothetical protein
MLDHRAGELPARRTHRKKQQLSGKFAALAFASRGTPPAPW